MITIRVAYFGTPIFAANLLESLLKDTSLPIEIPLVVTQPDRPVGKKQLITPSPVKEIAQTYSIDIYDRSTKSEELITIMQDKKIDLVLLFAYGEIITSQLLSIPRFGFWNIHPSLLPLYRGASPIAFPLLTGETKTGVSLMLMDEKLDHGPIIRQIEHEITPKIVRSELEETLTNTAIEMVQEEFTKLGSTEQMPILNHQEHSQATFTTMLHKNDGYIPYDELLHAVKGRKTAYIPHLLQKYIDKNSNISIPNIPSTERIYNLYRALHSWPGIWTKVMTNGQEKRLKITNCSFNNGRLCINKLQLEGKNEVDMTTFNAAYNLF